MINNPSQHPGTHPVENKSLPSSQSLTLRLMVNCKNPLVILMMALGIVSYLSGDLKAVIVIFILVLLGVVYVSSSSPSANKAQI